MHTTEKTAPQKTKDDPAHDLGQMGGKAQGKPKESTIVGQGFIVRLLGIKIWNRALVDGRFRTNRFQPRMVLKYGRHTGVDLYFGMRPEFGGKGKTLMAFMEDVCISGGALDAPQYLNAGSMEATDEKTASSSTCGRF